MSDFPSTFNIILQRGIEGGFAPPTPTARYLITRQPNSTKFTTSAQIRPDGTPSLLPPREKELELADHLKEISTIQELVRDLPTQYPGAQDIYGRNTSIVYLTSESAALGSHLYGSVAGHGIPPPTEEQKQKFDKAVELIEKLAGSE